MVYLKKKTDSIIKLRIQKQCKSMCHMTLIPIFLNEPNFKMDPKYPPKFKAIKTGSKYCFIRKTKNELLMFRRFKHLLYIPYFMNTLLIHFESLQFLVGENFNSY